MGLRKEILIFPVKPQIYISKNGKIQELIAEKTPNIPDPIRGMLSYKRFTISEILKLALTIKVGQFLDKSDVARRKLAYSM